MGKKTKTKTKLDREPALCDDAEIAPLLSEANAKIDALKAENAELHAEIEELEQKIATTSGVAELQEKLEAEEEGRKLAEDELSSAKAYLNDLKPKFAKAQDRLQRLEADRVRLESEIGMKSGSPLDWGGDLQANWVERIMNRVTDRGIDSVSLKDAHEKAIHAWEAMQAERDMVTSKYARSEGWKQTLITALQARGYNGDERIGEVVGWIASLTSRPAPQSGTDMNQFFMAKGDEITITLDSMARLRLKAESE